MNLKPDNYYTWEELKKAYSSRPTKKNFDKRFNPEKHAYNLRGIDYPIEHPRLSKMILNTNANLDDYNTAGTMMQKKIDELRSSRKENESNESGAYGYVALAIELSIYVKWSNYYMIRRMVKRYGLMILTLNICASDRLLGNLGAVTHAYKELRYNDSVEWYGDLGEDSKLLER